MEMKDWQVTALRFKPGFQPPTDTQKVFPEGIAESSVRPFSVSPVVWAYLIYENSVPFPGSLLVSPAICHLLLSQ